MKKSKKKPVENKMGYLIIERIIITIIFFVAILLTMGKVAPGIGNFIVRVILDTVFIVAFVYNLKCCIYMLWDFNDGPEVRCMKYKKMKTKEREDLSGFLGAYDLEPQYLNKDKWAYGKIWFCVEQNTIENRIIFAILNWIYCWITSLFFIEPDDRTAIWNLISQKQETCVYRGILKGSAFKEVYKKGNGAEVVYYRRSRIIKELRVCENTKFKEEIKIRYEKNRRYEFVGIKNLQTRRDYGILLRILMQMSEEKKVFIMIMDEEKVKGINKDEMVHYWKDSEPGLCAMELSGLNKNTVNIDLFKNKEMYITVCTTESDLTWDIYTHDEDPVIWNIDEGKVYAYIHISDEGIEITGAPGLREIKTISEKFRNLEEVEMKSGEKLKYKKD